MKSKLQSRKSSTPCVQTDQNKDNRTFSKILELYRCETEEIDKENIDFYNRNQDKVTPFLSERSNMNIRREEPLKIMTLREETLDPKFGQFHKKIKDILNGVFN